MGVVATGHNNLVCLEKILLVEVIGMVDNQNESVMERTSDMVKRGVETAAGATQQAVNTASEATQEAVDAASEAITDMANNVVEPDGERER